MLLTKLGSAINKLTIKQFYTLLNKVNNNPDLINPAVTYHIHKDVSCLSFFVKDVFRFLTHKADGIYLFVANYELIKRKKLIRKLMNLKKYM